MSLTHTLAETEVQIIKALLIKIYMIVHQYIFGTTWW